VLLEAVAPYSSGGAINMNAPIITIGCVSNLYSRQMHFINKGDVELGHTHLYDHFTLLATGSLRVTIDGADTVFTAPNMIFIRKDKTLIIYVYDKIKKKNIENYVVLRFLFFF
jgi:hypothetical protein